MRLKDTEFAAVKLPTVYLLLKVSPDDSTLMTPCSRVCISLIIHVYASYECTHTMFISKK